MVKTLVIVESPGKIKTIKSYLGSNYIVLASVGHILDLPSKSLNIDIEDNFKPTYSPIPTKKKVISDLKSAFRKADDVLIATDKDREGEMIGWSIAHILGINNPKRIIFTSITKTELTKAVNNPGVIDEHMVDAQKARRILDRILGYYLSPLLWKNINAQLSAGRVQSVVVRLIIDRENEIKDFFAGDITSFYRFNGYFYYILTYHFFSPNFMVRYAPGHMRNISGDDVNLNYANLYSLNKTSEMEDGLSAILGFDFKINEKDKDGIANKKFSMSMGQVFSNKDNKDIPSASSLNQKTSDLVGEMSYNFSKIGNIEYKFSLDQNFNDLNYNEISTNLNLGKFAFNLDYLEERNHVGNEHYVNAGISLEISNHNKLNFLTKKNFKTDSTEFYDMSYQYTIDCLTAGLVYRREFYEDADVEPKDKLMFTISFVPFSGVKTPNIIQ